MAEKLSEWKSEGLRRSGVMSTGMGGTNAFLILEEAPITNRNVQSDLPNLLILSAKSEPALDQSTMQLKIFLEKNENVEIRDAAYTLQQGRKTFDHRKFFVCKHRNDAIEILNQDNSKRIFSSKIQNNTKRLVIFLFPGIGDHYVGMGYDLYQKVKVFKETVDECAAILNNYIDMDIREVLYPKDYVRTQPSNSSGIDLKQMLAGRVNKSADEHTQKLNKTLYAQPALFTVEYALAKLWMNLGIFPDAIVGHSLGEYVAACLAGVFTLEEALKLIAVRAKLVNNLPQGGMLAVTLPEKELIPILGEELSISLINTPNLCVVAGAEDRIAQFEEVLKEKKILYRQVQNAHAFHSKMMDPIFDEFVNELKGIKLKSPQIPYTSNLTGNWITENEAGSPVYWAKHTNHTARFSDALQKAWQLNDNILLEIGPGNTLSVLAMQHPESRKAENPITVSSLRPVYNNQSDMNYLLGSIGNLWLSGVEIDWNKLYEDEKPKRIPLPTYPFQKENFWIEEKPANIDEISQILRDKTKYNKFKDWFYIPSWKRSEEVKGFDDKIRHLKNSSWLVFSSGSKFEKKIIKKLNDFSCKIIVVEKGKSFSIKENRKIFINQKSEEHYKKLYKELIDRKFYPNYILHFWNYDSTHNLTTSKEQLESSLYDSVYSLLFIAKNLQILDGKEEISLGIITNNIHNVLGDEHLASPETSMILGPAKVINKEIENIFCKCIDFSDEKDILQKQTDQLLTELISKDENEIVAFRGNYRWLNYFDQVDLLKDEKFEDIKLKKLKSGGIYLITGGTGGLGLVFAEHFARTENVKLILIKKSGFPERSKWQNWIKENNPEDKTSIIINKIMDIERLGSEIDVQNCDISDVEETKLLILDVEKKYGKINGIIHAAGIIDDGIILNKSIESVRRVLNPKIFGILSLNKHLDFKKLDFVILFSSINSFLAPSGQIDYSAANNYLDAFTIFKQSQGNIFGINWPGWRDVGILANLKVKPNLEKWKENLLEKAISSTDGIKALAAILNNSLSQVLVSPEILKYDRIKKLISIQNKKQFDEESEFRLIQTTISKINDSPINDTLNKVELKLTSLWQEILGVKNIKKTDNFFELGGHSLIVIQLLAAIRKSFKTDIDFQLLFEASTLEKMAIKIFERLNNSI